MPRKNLDRYSMIKPAINFYSKKNARLMYCESGTELGALYQLEFDRSVARYQTQPETFGYRIKGQERRYTPDTLIKTDDGRYYYEEVKLKEEAESSEFKRKFGLLERVFEDKIGVPLRLRIADAPHRCVQTGNAQYLYKDIDYPLSEQELDAIAQLSFSTQLGDALKSLKNLGHGTKPLYAALAQNLIQFDMSLQINRSTQLEALYV